MSRYVSFVAFSEGTLQILNENMYRQFYKHRFVSVCVYTVRAILLFI